MVSPPTGGIFTDFKIITFEQIAKYEKKYFKVMKPPNNNACMGAYGYYFADNEVTITFLGVH